MTDPGNQVNTVGDTVSLPIAATDSGGLALTYSGTLPPGLAIGSSSGQITGTLTTPGISTVTITATDTSGKSGSTTFTWTVNNPVQISVTVASPGDQVNTVGDTVSMPITASDSGGLALTYSDNGTLPAGLTIDSSSGLITGSPSTAGTYAVTITATDTSGNTGSATFTWTVS